MTRRIQLRKWLCLTMRLLQTKTSYTVIASLEASHEPSRVGMETGKGSTWWTWNRKARRVSHSWSTVGSSSCASRASLAMLHSSNTTRRPCNQICQPNSSLQKPLKERARTTFKNLTGPSESCHRVLMKLPRLRRSRRPRNRRPMRKDYAHLEKLDRHHWRRMADSFTPWPHKSRGKKRMDSRQSRRYTSKSMRLRRQQTW